MVYNKLRSLLSHSRLPVRISSMNPRPRVVRVNIRTAERSSFMWPFLGAFSLIMATKMVLGDGERTIFIPLSLTREVSQPSYDKDDAIVKIYTDFHHDQERQVEVKNRIADITVKAFEKERAKFGGNMGCSIMWLWFQYPTAPPPEHQQSGLEISRDRIRWTTHTMHPYNFHRLTNIIWPQWMYNSLTQSFHRVVATIRDEIQSATNKSEGTSESEDATIPANQSNASPKITPLITIPHPDFTAKVAFDETVGNFKQDLRKTRKPPPPPKGHVRVSGIVQITGEKLLVHVDVDATFDPETCDHFLFHVMKVRYVAHIPPRGRLQHIPPGIKSQQQKQEQAMISSHRPPPPPLEPPKAEGLLENAKVAMEQVRKARTERTENRTRSGDVIATPTAAAVAAGTGAATKARKSSGQEASEAVKEDIKPVEERIKAVKGSGTAFVDVGGESVSPASAASPATVPLQSSKGEHEVINTRENTRSSALSSTASSSSSNSFPNKSTEEGLPSSSTPHSQQPSTSSSSPSSSSSSSSSASTPATED